MKKATYLKLHILTMAMKKMIVKLDTLILAKLKEKKSYSIEMVSVDGECGKRESGKMKIKGGNLMSF